jgi:hypothetical protein
MAKTKKPKETITPSDDLTAQAVLEGQPPFTCHKVALVRCSEASPDANSYCFGPSGPKCSSSSHPQVIASDG